MIRFFQWLCIMCMSILPSIIPAQEWVARYDGPVSENDIATAIAIDNMGNVYVTGASLGYGTLWEYATVKYNGNGTEQWVARYAGPGVEGGGADAIAIDDAGNVYVTGSNTGSGSLYDYVTVKYNGNGTEQWVARYNGPGNDNDYAYDIGVDELGNVYVTGYSKGLGTNDDYATVKYDSDGFEQWVKRYNGPGNDRDYAVALVLDSAGNICVTGGSGGSVTGRDYATVKYDASGMEQWVARYNGPANDFDGAVAIAIDNTGNFYVTGTSQAVSTIHDYATVKYNSMGAEQWIARCNCQGDSGDWASAIAVDSAGYVYVTGSSAGSSYTDYATVKYDGYGGEQWVSHYYGITYNEPTAIAIDNNGNVYVTGWSMGTCFDYATVKYNNGGIEQWVARYNGPANDNDWATALVVDDAGYVYVTGFSTGVGTGRDYTTIKYSPTAIQEQSIISLKGEQLIATIIRGPLQLPEDKQCKIFDITGRAVEPTRIQLGIYFIEVDGVVTQKVVKIR